MEKIGDISQNKLVSLSESFFEIAFENYNSIFMIDQIKSIIANN